MDANHMRLPLNARRTACTLLMASLAGCSAGPWSRGSLLSSADPVNSGSTVVVEPESDPQTSMFTRAAKSYRKAARQTSDASSRWYGSAASYVRQGWGHVADAFHRPAVDPLDRPLSDGATTRLHLAAAAVCESRQDYTAAMDHYDKALAAEPTSAEARVGRARLFHRRGLLTLSIKEYERALDEHPNDALVLNDLGLCYARQGELQLAEKMLSKAVEKRPAEARYRNNLAAVMVRQGKVDQAVDALQPSLGEAVAHYNVGHFLYQQGSPSDALTHFELAAQLDPTLADARQMASRLSVDARSMR